MTTFLIVAGVYLVVWLIAVAVELLLNPQARKTFIDAQRSERHPERRRPG